MSAGWPPRWFQDGPVMALGCPQDCPRMAPVHGRPLACVIIVAAIIDSMLTIMIITIMHSLYVIIVRLGLPLVLLFYVVG